MKMLISLQTALVIAFTLPYLTASETLYEALSKDKQLSEFFKMVKKDEVLQVLLDRRTVTIFAPTNEAIRRADAKRNRKDETKLASFHVLNLLARKEKFPLLVAPYLAGVAPLFLSLKDKDQGRPKEYFVNNAKIIREREHRGTEGGTQLLYVIDELLELYDPITALPPTALELLKQPTIYNLKEPLDAFSSRVTSDREKDIFQRVGNHTFFLPIGTVDNENFNRLQDIDTWVVRSHVISKHVLFTRTMSRKSYKSETYGENLKVELTLMTNKLDGDDGDDKDEEWYIHSNTIQSDQRHRKGVVRSKIIIPNIPVSNGVVHLIGSPLMIIDHTILDFIDKEKDNHLKQFYQLVSKNPVYLSHMRSSQQRTVFAPTDKAFQALDKEKLHHVLSNATAAQNLLELHMVMKSVATEDVWNKNVTTLLASDNRRSLYFGVNGDERNKTLTVEGGGVNATAVMGDIGATNGILHVIDRVLGMPYLTIYSKLAHDPDLHTTFKLGSQADWYPELNKKEKSYTFFVPNRKAWEELRKDMPSEHKQLHLVGFEYYVRKILDRHLVVGMELTKEDLERKEEIQMVHGTFRVSPGFQNGKLIVEWEGVRANIVRPDVQATNGIIHVIDKVMMKRRDLTKSASPTTFPSIATMAFTFLLNIMYFSIL